MNIDYIHYSYLKDQDLKTTHQIIHQKLVWSSNLNRQKKSLIVFYLKNSLFPSLLPYPSLLMSSASNFGLSLKKALQSWVPRETFALLAKKYDCAAAATLSSQKPTTNFLSYSNFFSPNPLSLALARSREWECSGAYLFSCLGN